MDVDELVQLESDAWASEMGRNIYSTPDFPGFPWYTIRASSTQPSRRYVIPYYYTFRVFVKGRWVGRSLLDIYSEEHAHHSREYYEKSIQQGRLRRQPRVHYNIRKNRVKRIRGVDEPGEGNFIESFEEPVILNAGDVVLHTIHRHEVPVCMGITGLDPIVLAAVRIMEYGLLVVHKPSGIPTHAGGRYFMNSCTAMLEYVLAPKRLYAWLVKRDPLLQSVVSTTNLNDAECQELLAYYSVKNEEATNESIPIERLPRPCHRLDKVTSGVLLFGVSRLATRRLADILTKKTKQMEEVFLKQLQRIGSTDNDEAKEKKEGDMQILPKAMLEGFDVGVRKRYLARVYGHFPNYALHLGRLKWTALGDVENNDKHLACERLFIAPFTNNMHTTNNILTNFNDSNYPSESDKVQVFDNADLPVLITSPVSQLRFCEKDLSEEPLSPQLMSPCDSEGKQQKKPFYQAAATFCQPIRHFRSCGMRKDDDDNNNNNEEEKEKEKEETLVQCVPLTGRMHQIRVHLSDWGHPIIGDASYNINNCQANSSHEMEVQDFDKEIMTDGNKGVTLHFRPEDLPKAYRETFYTCDSHCWECTGQIPLAYFGNRNSSVIALHAWQYELDHHLLLEGDSDNPANLKLKEMEEDEKEQNKNKKDLLQTPTEPECQEQLVNYEHENPLGLCCSWGDVVRWQGEYVRRQGKVVIFSSPPPLWTHH